MTTNCAGRDDPPTPGTGGDDPPTPGTGGDDPRTTGEFVRTAPGSDGAGELHLVGVVHGHPASSHRVGAVVDAVSPDVVGLELPPIALPLFEQRVGAGDRDSRSGGEMRAAIRAAPQASVVGIDGPSLRFAARLARTLLSERASRATTASVLASTAGVTREALSCRVAAVRRSLGAGFGVGAGTGGEAVVGDDVAIDTGNPGRASDGPCTGYDVDSADAPSTQATDEREHVRRGTALRGLLSPSPASRIRTTAREEHMIDRLAALRSTGTVVAVVGMDHLDAVAGGVGDERRDR